MPQHNRSCPRRSARGLVSGRRPQKPRSENSGPKLLNSPYNSRESKRTALSWSQSWHQPSRSSFNDPTSLTCNIEAFECCTMMLICGIANVCARLLRSCWFSNAGRRNCQACSAEGCQADPAEASPYGGQSHMTVLCLERGAILP